MCVLGVCAANSVGPRGVDAEICGWKMRINTAPSRLIAVYSLLFALAGAGITETFGERIVVDFQLGDLRDKRMKRTRVR